MESFHIIVLVVATITLILLLTICGILLHNVKRNEKFPPTHAKCPDEWTYDDTNNKCSPNTNSANKRDYDYVLDQDPCKNKEWADTNKIYWDGLTTYNGC